MRSRNLLAGLLLAACLLAVVAGLTAAPAASAGGAAVKPADTVLTNGKVYTVEASAPTAQAVAVRAGKIVYVGTSAGAAKYVGPGTEVIDLKGKLLMPGFVDSHMHAGMTASQLFSVQLYGLPSIDAYLATIADFATQNPSLEIIRGEGWSNTLAPGIGPLASDLDSVVSDRPVALQSEDYHSLWCNSKALALGGITGKTPDPANGVIERLPGTVSAENPYGIPSGTLRETAVDMVTSKIPDYSVAQYAEGIRYFQEQVAAPLGITTVFDPLLSVGSNAVAAYQQLAASGELTVRTRAALGLTPDDNLKTWLAAASAERARHTTDLFQTNAVKLFMDGVVEGHTAYLAQDYADAPGDRGTPIWLPAQFNAACAAIDKTGFQIHVHSIGDAATTETLDGLAYARKVNGRRDWRPGITHLQLVSPADFKRFASLGVTAVPQPYWFLKDDYYTYLQVPYLGLPRADFEYPMKSFFDAGVLVASASDFPVTYPPDPLDGIQTGVMRWFPEWVKNPNDILWPSERVTVQQMIASFTLNGAKANFLDTSTGSIKVGKSADLIVLNRDITTVNPTLIGDTRVMLTLFKGDAVYRDSQL
jgi:predicted amidohydrolase YtcJ